MANDLAAIEARLVGRSPAFLRTLADARRVAPYDNFPVLILGENGTGKEEIARYLHALSVRAGKPFVAVNCGAIARDLFESEMFGHERGAFTGAVGTKKGLFELADGGVLLLDEVGELGLDHQAKLLRAIQQQEIRRVGAENVRRVSVRLIAATNRDLWGMVKQRAFREDLFFRLSRWTLRLPPLRERGDDILEIARAALDAEGFAGRVLADDAAQLLLSYPWPGNIRELVNAVASGAVRADGPAIRAVDLAPALVDAFPMAPVDDVEGVAPHDVFVPDVADGLDLDRAVRVARELLAAKRRFRRAEFGAVMNLDKSQSNKRLRQLVEHGIIRTCGKGPTTFYVAP